MEISALEKELDIINRKYAQSKPPTLHTPNHKPSLDLNSSSAQNRQSEKGNLNQYSTEELEKLIELKNQSLEKLQAHNLYPNTQPKTLPENFNISNPNITSILNKYGVSPVVDHKRMGSADISIEQPSASVNQSFNQSHDFASFKDRFGKSNLLGSSLGATQNKFENQGVQNPYLNNVANNHFETRRELREVSPGFRQHSSEKGTSLQSNYDIPKTNAFEGTPSKHLAESTRSNKENMSNQQLTPSARGRSQDSSAIANAMKALQEKLKNAENEIAELKRVTDGYEGIKQSALKDQQRKFESELNMSREKENHLQHSLDRLNDENTRLRDEVNRLKSITVKNEDEITNNRISISKLKDEIHQHHQERNLLNKEIEIIENEKNHHLEQNATDKDDLERRMDSIIHQLEVEHEKVKKLETEKREIYHQKQEAELHISRIAEQTSAIDKKYKDMVIDLEQKLDNILRQNKADHEEFRHKENGFLQERDILIKRIDDAEGRILSLNDAFDDRIRALKVENKELQKVNKSQREDIESIKKKLGTMEKLRERFERELIEKDEIIKNVKDFNDELLVKLKESSNPNLKAILYKKKKLDDKVHKVEKEIKILSTSRSGSVSKKRKASASRSPTGKKSAKKSNKLHIDDLNLSHEDIRARRSSTSKKRHPSESQDTSVNHGSSSIQESKVATPRRSIPVSANKKDRLRSIERNLDRSAERDRSKDREGYRESDLFNKSNRKSSIGELDARNINRLSSHALLTPVDPSNKYGLGSDNRYTPRMSEDTGAGLRDRPGVITNIEIGRYGNERDVTGRMNSDQLSKEIVKIEREIAELKREYKNLLARSQMDNVEDITESRNRMNFVANELQIKSETHLLLKKKQREILSKNI